MTLEFLHVVFRKYLNLRSPAVKVFHSRQFVFCILLIQLVERSDDSLSRFTSDWLDVVDNLPSLLVAEFFQLVSRHVLVDALYKDRGTIVLCQVGVAAATLLLRLFLVIVDLLSDLKGGW